jgi:beta-galactosidase
VNLLLVSERHFELEESGMPGIHATPAVHGDQADLKIETWVNSGEDGREQKSLSVRYTLREPGTDRMWTETVPAAECRNEATLHLDQIHLWDGLDDPFLYEVKAELISSDDGAVLDTVDTRFGCRTFSFDRQKGFMLNGRSYPLRGVSKHQDRKAVGNAVSEDMLTEDMELIREIGATSVRLAHYQHSQKFYDLCDENGLIVWAEIPYITRHMEEGRANTLSQMRELITQCYNHPSIVCWGLSNEITASGPADESVLENHRLLNRLCHELDQTRPTTMAHVFMLETDSPMLEIADIGSYNLYFGWYLGELEQNERFLDEYHETYPGRVIGLSEYGADANLQFHSSSPEKGDYTEEYQCLYHEHMLKMIEERPYLWSTYVWNMFDFAADGRDEGGAHGLNQKGLVTFDRKERKDAFYLYKAAWQTRDKFAHICGKRYRNRAQKETVLKVYSNLDELTLVVDGTVQENRKGKTVFEFTLQMPEERDYKTAIYSGEQKLDQAVIHRSHEEDPSCHFRKTGIMNWFETVQMKEGFYSIKDTLGDLKKNARTGAIVAKVMEKAIASRGDVAKGAGSNPALEKMMAGMSLDMLLRHAGEAVSGEQIRQLNAMLQNIPKEDGEKQ